MPTTVGLDIGTVSIKLAALLDAPPSPVLLPLGSDFFTASFPPESPHHGSSLLLSNYRRIQGTPLESARQLLRDFYAVIPETKIDGVRVTGSGAELIANLLTVDRENEFRALARGVREMYPQVRTVFEMGGENSRYLSLDPTCSSKYLGILDYQGSGECAAGTGSFLDQQASRLLYSIDDVGPAACSASCSARVAGRCSVFAKTDMIHAQQRGYTTDQILRGLCEAVARNFKSSIVKGRRVQPPVAFLGGVGKNQSVRNALQELFRLQPDQFFVPELYAWMGALGAALFEADAPRKHRPAPVAALDTKGHHSFASLARLSLANVRLLRKDARLAPRPQSRVPAYLGIDIGSVSTNLVVLDEEGRLLKEIYLATQGRPIEVVSRGLAEIEEELADVLEIVGVGTTGSGRELIGELIGADTVNDEITAHKTGAIEVCRQLKMESVDTIFEIGGQDAKFIRLDHGIVIDFTMNEACAAGTGSFLEEQAEKLGISIKNDFARMAMSSSAPIQLGERCTVFMERDVTSLLLRGAQRADLCAGLAYSVALNYLNRVVRGRKIGKTIFFQGGTAYNDAVAAAFSQILGQTIIVPPHNGVIGAIGMALLAREKMQHASRPTSFRGYNLAAVQFTSRDFVCRACSNYCDMKEFVIEGQKSYWGDKCSDKFRKRARAERQPVIDDLFEYRDRLLDNHLASKPDARGTIGIPRTMFFYDRFPFWATYVRELGFALEVSPATDGSIAATGEELALSQPCFPIQVAHGHAQALFERGLGYVLLPNVVNTETPEPNTQSHLCPWNQTLPFVVRAVPQFEQHAAQILSPTVYFRLGPQQVEKDLWSMAQALGRDSATHRNAVRSAFAAQTEFQNALLHAGQRALAVLDRTAEPAIVLLGRPYNIYDRGANCDIPRKLRTLYGINVIPLDFLPLHAERVSDINSNMFWNSGRLILAAARFTSRHPNLHLIYISNFKCGPDSFIKSFLPDAAKKPALFLQFDGHSNDAGYLTRCEAYLDSKGILRCHSATAA